MTPPLKTLPQELTELLERQVDLLGALQAVLVREPVALASQGQEEVLSLAEEKQQLGLRLTDLSLELKGMLERSPYSADGQGLTRLVGEAPDDGRLEQLHMRAVQALRVCLADNRSVGALLERRRSAVERALRIFFDASEETNLYQASGRLHTAGANNHLIAEA